MKLVYIDYRGKEVEKELEPQMLRDIFNSAYNHYSFLKQQEGKLPAGEVKLMELALNLMFTIEGNGGGMAR